MTSDELAAIHARAMRVPSPWAAKDFHDLLSHPGAILTSQSPDGFALGRVVLDEAELLTIAVDPEMQGKGTGRRLLTAFEEEAVRRGARTGHLEVAVKNITAISLYHSAGWSEVGRRKQYYRTRTGREDALLFSKELTSA